MPLLVSTGYIRLVSLTFSAEFPPSDNRLKKVVVLKEKRDRKAYQDSAQLACEATVAIRTVASLTGEDHLCRLYSESLQKPVKRGNREALISNFAFALSSSMQYYIIGLVFWYGSRLLSNFQVSPVAFLVCLFVSRFA